MSSSQSAGDRDVVLGALAAMGSGELGDLDALREVLHPDFECWVGAAREPLDADGYVRMLADMRAAFPDLAYEVPVPPIVDGNRAATTYRVGGTHTGAYQGMPATGARIDVGGLSMFEVEEGRVRRMWTAMDSLAMFTQLNGASS